MKKLKNIKNNWQTIVLGTVLLVAGVCVLFVVKPWNINLKQNVLEDKSEQKISVSNNDVTSSVNIDTEGQIDTDRQDLAKTYVESLFNTGYRAISSNTDSYAKTITDITTEEAYIMFDPETGNPYDFDVDGGTYTRSDLMDFVSKWFISNEVIAEATFVPKTETIITKGYLYYIGGDLQINIHSCDDLSSFAKYFQIEDMQLNTTYNIPIEIEIFEDYVEGYKIGQLFREFEFIDLYTD